MNLIEQIRRDREVGSQSAGTRPKADYETNETYQADLRRRRRVPSMEAALLAAEESDCVLGEAQDLKPDYSFHPETGEEWVSRPADQWAAFLYDVARVRAAFRKAIGDDQ